MTVTMVAEIIAGDPHGPYPAEGTLVRCHLRDGQVVDGIVSEVWLDLDTVRVDVHVPAQIRLTPAAGDRWEAK